MAMAVIIINIINTGSKTAFGQCTKIGSSGGLLFRHFSLRVSLKAMLIRNFALHRPIDRQRAKTKHLVIIITLDDQRVHFADDPPT